MRIRASLLCSLLIPLTARAILPLPYPTEPIEQSPQPGLETKKDDEPFGGYSELFSRGQLREMPLPSFDGQSGALGYTPGATFAVPDGLKTRVEFWKKIYAEYTSQQALLHDAEYPDLVYGVLDISPYVNVSAVSAHQQQRDLAEFIKKEKEKVASQLRVLDLVQFDPAKIPVDLFPLFRKLDVETDPGRFIRAIARLRVQVGQRDRIVRGFLYGGRYFPKMMEIFEKNGLPKELTRLPLVESTFNLGARSKVGASGIWQFMRSTGQRLLRIDQFVDERNDPLAATQAAASLLRANFEALGSWPLAITAYNHGREGMARAAGELNTKDLAYIIKHYKGHTFGFASSNFFSEFLAILEVEREYRKHFGNMLVDKPIAFEEFRVGDNVKLAELAKACSVQREELEVLNPGLTDFVLTGPGAVPQGFMLKIPVGSTERCRTGYRDVAKAG
jgi:membrane-bound lytic murein transglycosylase D